MIAYRSAENSFLSDKRRLNVHDALNANAMMAFKQKIQFIT